MLESGARKKPSKVLSSTLNSNSSMLPEFESFCSPVTSFEEKETGKEKKKKSSKPSKKAILKEELPEEEEEEEEREERDSKKSDIYRNYLRSVYMCAMMEDKLSEDRSKIEHHLCLLSKQLESKKHLLQKYAERLKDVTICAERETMLKVENEWVTKLLNHLEQSNFENIAEATDILNKLSQELPTKNIKVPHLTETVAEFQKIMDDIVSNLRSVSESTTPHAETYSEAEKLLEPIVELQGTTATHLQEIQNLKSSIQEDLILHCSREKSKQRQKELAQPGGCDILDILKDFHKELK